jgi:ATP-dependent RNA helicase CshB
MNFKHFNLKAEINQVLEQINFKAPTDIQQLVIPKVIKGKDVIGRAETGSGKTHAYLLPLVNNLDPQLLKTQALIITPTRELANQVNQMLLPFSQALNFKVQLLVGGLERSRTIEGTANVPQIIIGTLGRINDLAITNSFLNIANIKTLIIDEVDMVLEANNQEDLSKLLGKIRPSTQVLAFSATISQEIDVLLRKYMNSPILIDTNKTAINPPTIEHIAYPTKHQPRLMVLNHLLKNINPFLAIIFASRIETVTAIYQDLKSRKLNVGIIHGDLDQTTRRTMLKRLRQHQFTYLVASDIAARGLDIEGATHVINYDLPYEKEYFFHRAGRVGRNNLTGLCLTMYDNEDMNYLKFLKENGIKFRHAVYKDEKLVDLKSLFKEKKRPNNKLHPQALAIKKVINLHKQDKVKPGYKKKLKAEIAKIKQKHKREIIRKDIKRQIKERAIEQQKKGTGFNE